MVMCLKYVLFFVSLWAMVGCASLLESDERDPLPSDTVISDCGEPDEDFIDGVPQFVAHGFDERKTEYNYTVADVLESLYFPFDSAKISADERQKIMEIAKIFKKDSSIGILIVGNCDKFGTDRYNHSLGQRRAEAVRDVFIASGIGDHRIATASLGSRKANKNVNTPEAGGTDRRCDIVIRRADRF